ncbi:MAG TPA: FAD-dependent oxidoreductase [Caulobacteraceae bacterium]|jgi:3-phenylpropionate/trans-cinnamate dioxygenase ferredoxin reductase subunit|nr:FAD-dependent oxidoreductase [Caulobacteraceae bacterium]
MSETGAGVLIVGGGHAGGSAAAFLRQYGYEGRITVIGEEPIAPYQRPPLSKAWLKGEADADALALRPDSFYAEKDIVLRLSTRAVSIQRSAKTVTLETGETLPYDTLILATGARARRLNLPGADLDGVQVLRSAADAEVLKLALGPGKRLAVVGGGYIGLEAAASARALGAEAVVIEALPRILARSSCEALSTFFTDYHKARGVTFELGASIEGFEGVGGHVTGVKLADGRVIACDDVVVGIGIIPNDELARDAGLECANGVVVDLESRTADPAVFAIGDVTHRPMPLYERMFRLESVANALEQAKQAANAIAGRPPPAPEVTWNWSDQYDIKLQLAGMPFDTDDTLIRGDPAAAKFAVFHLKGDVIRSVEAINAPAEFMAARQLIGSQKPIDRAKLADTTVSMKEVAAS